MQDTQVKQTLDRAAMEREIASKREHYKIISELIRFGSADISNSPKWVAYANRYQMALEDYMACFPEDCADTARAAAAYRGELQNDGINRKSLAFYQLKGCLPWCISQLFHEVYPDAKDREMASNRFFNSFPAFKVTTRKL